MKIELKNVKHNERFSEETNCFSATLYVDGKRIGEVANRGYGGCDEYGFAYSIVDELNKRIAKEFPKIDGYGGEPFDASLETVIGDVLTDYLIVRDCKRALSRKILFKKDETPAIYTVAKTVPHEALLKKYPNAVILNALPIEKAVELFRYNPSAA